MGAEGLHADTVAVTAGRGARVPGGPLNPPLVPASTYHAGGEVSYGREHNPTWAAFEETVGALEGGHAVAFASGVAAVGAVLEQTPPGGLVVAPAGAYTGTRALLAEAQSRGRLRTRLVDVADTAAVLEACTGADLLWLESPTNPLLVVADVPALVTGARERGVRVAVDNTFCTPLLQRPLDVGADVVVHSATKFLGGHSDLLLGVAVTRDADVRDALLTRRTIAGAIPGTLEAWLALRGLRTLPLRLERGQAAAGELARRLRAHPAVTIVRYPGLPDDPWHARAAQQLRGFGAVLAFEVRGGAAAAERVCEHVRLITHATSLGGVETTMERRARSPQPPGSPPPPGLIRLSAGCEHVEDLWNDLARALQVVA